MNRVGKYNILERIGKGGMGVVYRALDTVLEREVALKTHTVEVDPEMQSIERFFREARVVARLKHPNIVTVYDLGHDGDKVFIAMELLEGKDLTSLLAGGRHIPLEEKLSIVECLARGLAHAHNRGIVHRDIKPRNVFVTDQGEVKLLDFGLAHIAQSTLTAAGQIIGTPFYMSPEQVLGEKANPQSDVFSLGSLFYELLTGERAFEGEHLEEIFDAILQEDPRPVRVCDPTIPEELARIVSRMTAKSKERRYATIDELLRDLMRFRGFLQQYKSQIRNEADQVLRELGSLARRNERIVADNDVAVPSQRLHDALKRDDLSYMSLVGLRDGANLQLRLLEQLVQDFTDTTDPGDAGDGTMTIYRSRTEPPGDAREERRRHTKADEQFRAAASHYSSGDLAGSLRLVCDALRLNPRHEEAGGLAEKVRTSIVQLAEASPVSQNEPKHIDVLVAALLAIGEPGGEGNILKGSSSHARGDIAGLSDIFLAGLPEDKSDPDNT